MRINSATFATTAAALGLCLAMTACSKKQEDHAGAEAPDSQIAAQTAADAVVTADQAAQDAAAAAAGAALSEQDAEEKAGTDGQPAAPATPQAPAPAPAPASGAPGNH